MPNHISNLALRTPLTAWKGKKIWHWNMSPRLEVVQYAIGEERRNSFRKNEEAESKQRWCPVADVSGGKSKVKCDEEYGIGTRNVRSMNQGKLDVVKQEITRVNMNILGISELKWMEMGKFNSDEHYKKYCTQEPLTRNGVALIINKRVQNAVLMCNLKNKRMISVHFQGKPFSTTVVQVCAPNI